MQATKHGPHRHGYRAAVFILAVHRWHAQTERRIFRMAFLLMARIRVRSAMRASIPLFYGQSPFCSSFSLELYIYKFISYTLLYIEETEVLSLHNRGFFW